MTDDPERSDTGEAEGCLALLVRVHGPDQRGVARAHQGHLERWANITYVDLIERPDGGSSTYFELEDVADAAALVGELEQLPIVDVVGRAPSFARIYGKRIIVIGGAQVGQVVVGAVAELTATTSAARGSRLTPSRWSARRSWRVPCGRWPACRRGARPGRRADGRRRRPGGLRGARPGHHRHLAQYGRLGSRTPPTSWSATRSRPRSWP